MVAGARGQGVLDKGRKTVIAGTSTLGDCMNIIEQVVEDADPATVEQIAALLLEVEELLDARQSADKQIAEINRLGGGRQYVEADLFEFYGWTSATELAQVIAGRVISGTQSLTRDEINLAVHYLTEGAEPQTSKIVGFFDDNFDAASLSALVFWPPVDLTKEELADEVELRLKMLNEEGVAAVQTHVEAFGIFTPPAS